MLPDHEPGAATLFGMYWGMRSIILLSAVGPGPLLRSWHDAEGWLAIVATGSWLVIALVMGLWTYRITSAEDGWPYASGGKVLVLGRRVPLEDLVNRLDIPPIRPPAWLLAKLSQEHDIAQLTLLTYDDSRYGQPRDFLIEFQHAVPGLRFFTTQLALEELLNRPISLLTAEGHRKGRRDHDLLRARVLWPCVVTYMPSRLSKPTAPASAFWLAPVLPWVEKPEQSVARPTLPLEPLAEFCRTYHIRRLALVDPVWRRGSISDDVKVLAEFDPGHVPGLLFFGLEQELSALVDRRIDLFTPGFIAPSLRQSILTTARVLYEAA